MRAVPSRDDIARWLVAQVADLLDIVPAEIDGQQAFTYYGLSSADGALLAGDLEDWLGCSLPASIAWEYPTIRSLADYLSTLVLATEAGTAASRILATAGAAELGDHPLSYNQQALWYLYQLAPESKAYHIVHTGRVRSGVDADALRRALGDLVARHAVLRTMYPVVGGVPVQRVHAALDVPLIEEDATAWSAATLRTRFEAAAQAPFRLEDQGPMRMVLYHATPPVLLLAVHHIAADLWSLAVMVRDLGALYDAAVEGRSAGLAPLQLCYADFARWQAEI